MSDVPDDELLVPGLPGVVVERLRTELGERAEKVLGCLRTAATLVAQAEADVSGLRLAESAAYNLREALNHVVEGRMRPRAGCGPWWVPGGGSRTRRRCLALTPLPRAMSLTRC